MSNAFEAKGVVKHFGKVTALDGLSLKAEQGTVFGLLGPNGAGKTTLVRMLSTLLVPDKGTVKVLGIDAVRNSQRVREVIGLAGQYAAVDEFQTGYENIYMTGRLYRLSAQEAKRRAQELLERFELTEAANRPVRTYSGGMQRRLDLCASLIGRPKILFLDEPTNGLDPKTRIDLWNIIRELVSEGTSILLTTQYLEEADELANRIAVIDQGKVIAEGTSIQLKAQLGGDMVEFVLEKDADRPAALRAVRRFASKQPAFDETGLTISVPVTNHAKSLAGIAGALDRSRIRVSSFSLHQPSLDDVFLSLTGAATKDTNQNPQRETSHAAR